MKYSKIIALALATGTLALGIFGTYSLFKTTSKEAKADLPTYSVYIDMNGHGESRWVDVRSGTTVRQVVLDHVSVSEYTDGDYYLIGFNESAPLSDSDDGLYRFYNACIPFYNFQITRSMGIVAGWTKYPEQLNTFHAPKAKTITKIYSIQEIGNFYFTDVPVPSYYCKTPDRYYYVDIETSDLVNTKDASDKQDFEIYYNVVKTTKLTIGEQQFDIYERDDAVDLFYKKFKGDKEFVYLDAYGEGSDFSKLDIDYTGKVVLLNRGGGLTFQEKVDQAHFNGAEALLIVNSMDGYVSMSLDETHDMCLGVINLSAGAVLKENGTAHTVDGLTYYTGTFNIASKRDDKGIPFSSYGLSYNGPNKTDECPLYLGISNPNELQENTTYQFTISYKLTIYDSDGMITQDETELEQKTVVTVDTNKAAPVDPVEPEQPEEPAKKKGCGGSLVAASAVVSLISLAGLGLVIYKRRKEQ